MILGTRVRSRVDLGAVAWGIVGMGADSHDQREGATPVVDRSKGENEPATKKRKRKNRNNRGGEAKKGARFR